MSSTNENRADGLAVALLEDVVLPLTAKREAEGAPAYFPLSGDTSEATYYGPPTRSVMKPEDFDLPGGGVPDGLIDALAAHWTAQGETGLVAMIPQMKEIAAALTEEANEADGDVDILCYTMF